MSQKVKGTERVEGMSQVVGREGVGRVTESATKNETKKEREL